MGDIIREEFAFGSKRIDEWLGEVGASHRGGLGIEGEKPFKRFDDEFGSSPEMAMEIREFAEEEGDSFKHIKVGRSPDLSALSAYLIYQVMASKKSSFEGSSWNSTRNVSPWL